MNRKWIFAGLICSLLVVGAEGATKRYAGRINVKGDLEKDRESSKSEGQKSSSKTKTESQYYDLQVTVANTGKYEGIFECEWYFFSRPLLERGKKGDPELSEKGKKSFNLKGMKRESFELKSKTLTWSETKTNKNSSNKNNNNNSNKKSINGSVYGGYVVLLRVDGKIISRYSPDSKMKSDDFLGRFSIPLK